MKDNFSKALLAPISAFAKAKRLSPLFLASLSLLANTKPVRDILSNAPLARISAFAKAERLSPLMLASLALLVNTTTLSSLFLLRALIGWGDPEPSPMRMAPACCVAQGIPYFRRFCSRYPDLDEAGLRQIKAPQRTARCIGGCHLRQRPTAGVGSRSDRFFKRWPARVSRGPGRRGWRLVSRRTIG